MKHLLPLLLILLTVVACKAPSGDERVQRGVVAYREGDLAKAAEEFELALEAGVTENPEPEVRTLLAQVYQRDGRDADAMAAYLATTEAHPRYPAAYVNLAAMQLEAGNEEAAVATYLAGIEAAPDLGEVRAAYGAHLIEEGDYVAATEQLTAAVEANPGYNIAWANLAFAAAAMGDFERADELLFQAVQLGYTNGQNMKMKFEEMKGAAGTETGDETDE